MPHQYPEIQYLKSEQEAAMISENGTHYHRIFTMGGITLWMKKDHLDHHKLRITADPDAGQNVNAKENTRYQMLCQVPHNIQDSCYGTVRSARLEVVMLTSVYEQLQHRSKWLEHTSVNGVLKGMLPPRLVFVTSSVYDLNSAVADAVHAIMIRYSTLVAETGKWNVG
jgi:hypothetical protein